MTNKFGKQLHLGELTHLKLIKPVAYGAIKLRSHDFEIMLQLHLANDDIIIVRFDGTLMECYNFFSGTVKVTFG